MEEEGYEIVLRKCTLTQQEGLHMIFYSKVRTLCDPRRNRLDDGKDTAAAFEKRPQKNYHGFLARKLQCRWFVHSAFKPLTNINKKAQKIRVHFLDGLIPHVIACLVQIHRGGMQLVVDLAAALMPEMKEGCNKRL